ncbi:hypothetical protein MW290_32265 (plasmid) [Aquincola tertiaricarbonis]|uniref:StbC n=1 Tax=Aquincola tertiaricarbonis TaxID=391953 RepID=A0ABY4SII1_AQUTE|nr:hypothetical protein [Aquincola tertiaricarbonis]URI11970.1 hypothetical protein MW290_32265 [Aquincola tertiaricarbonis]
MDRPLVGTEQPAPGSALDFLIAELLGDVGKVDAAIKTLRDRLGDTEDRIRSAGTAAANTVVEVTQQAFAELADKRAQEEFKHVHAARVEAANLRSAFMIEARAVLRQIQVAKLKQTRHFIMASALIATVSCLAGVAMGYALANGWSP